jgi:hypothetical protein
MPSSGILRCEALVRSDISEKHIAFIIRVKRLGELEIAIAVTSIRSTILRSVLLLLVTDNVVPSSPILVSLMMEAIRYFEMWALTRATRLKIPEDDSLHSQTNSMAFSPQANSTD